MMSTITLWALIIGTLIPRLMDRFSEERILTVFFTDGDCVELDSEGSCNVHWARGGVHHMEAHRDLLGQTGSDWTDMNCSLTPELQIICRLSDASETDEFVYGVHKDGQLWDYYEADRAHPPLHLYRAPVPKVPLRSMKGHKNALVGLTPDGRILRWPTLHEVPRLRRLRPKRRLISDATQAEPGYTLSRRKYIDYAVSVGLDELGVDEQGELRILSHIHPELPPLVARLKAGGGHFTRVWARHAYEFEEYTRLTTFCALTEAKAMRCANARGAYLERSGPYHGATLSTSRVALLTEAGEIELYSVAELQPITADPKWLTPMPPQRFAEISLDDISLTTWLCGIPEDRQGALCWGDSDYTYGINVEAPLRVEAGTQSQGCGVLANGRILCWGDNLRGRAASPGWHAYAIAAGDLHGCALRTYDHQAVCWGDNTYGQSDPPPGVWAQIEAAGVETCATRPTGERVCWGTPICPAEGPKWDRRDRRPVWRPKYWPRPAEGWPELPWSGSKPRPTIVYKSPKKVRPRHPGDTGKSLPELNSSLPAKPKNAKGPAGLRGAEQNNTVQINSVKP